MNPVYSLTPELKSNISDCVLMQDSKIANNYRDISSGDLKAIAKGTFGILNDFLLHKYGIDRMKKFHNSLNFCEKYIPFIGKEKEFDFQKTLRFKMDLLHIGTEIAGTLLIDVLPDLVHYFQKRRTAIKIFESLTAHSLWINASDWADEEEGMSIFALSFLKRMLSNHKISNPEKHLRDWAEQYFNERFSALPHPPDEIMDSIDNKAFYFSCLLKTCDGMSLSSEDSKTRKLLYEYGEGSLGFTKIEMEAFRSSTLSDQLVLGKAIDIPVINLSDHFADVLDNIRNGHSRVDYLVLNDPFKAKRDMVRGKVSAYAPYVAGALLTIPGGPVFDFLAVLGAPIVSNLLQDKGNEKMADEYMERYWEGIRSLKRKRLELAQEAEKESTKQAEH